MDQRPINKTWNNKLHKENIGTKLMGLRFREEFYEFDFKVKGRKSKQKWIGLYPA